MNRVVQPGTSDVLDDVGAGDCDDVCVGRMDRDGCSDGVPRAVCDAVPAYDSVPAADAVVVNHGESEAAAAVGDKRGDPEDRMVSDAKDVAVGKGVDGTGAPPTLKPSDAE